MSGKTKKSLLKRFKITKTGKVLKRLPGQNHFKAKRSRRNQLAQNKWRPFDVSKKIFNQYIN
ncbi:MAG: hypothetical protein A3H02_00610 [Candidatus Niyogibacteria bacterium RIFCSPLOWO2_12_FULL_41_13]|uniref:50S ribosomal protein L35 n=1 Tax=Candidatus Niyogibacteria bacterium RIFCSPLOWO2_12_FULL_41_13 TaxID=1801726 RepID=A0A1G2F335_9BACT|nr:MAG: hypothetical protein A3H02_00610 [Candidatus Niyogibacteria bacterium RIFCSPLOWO2_12_FULL_41_13]